jgi:hypothetical protein
MITEPIKSENAFPDLFASRLIVLLETSADSNKYLQVMLTKEKWEKFSDFMKSLIDVCNDKTHDHTIPHSVVHLYDDFSIKLPEQIENHYSKEKIQS